MSALSCIISVFASALDFCRSAFSGITFGSLSAWAILLGIFAFGLFAAVLRDFVGGLHTPLSVSDMRSLSRPSSVPTDTSQHWYNEDLVGSILNQSSVPDVRR